MSGAHEEPMVFRAGAAFRQYVVESFLGAGISGQVYAVRHQFTGDRFALKVAHLKDRGSAKAAARALQEARATYGIRHQNVVRVFDLACEDDGMVWQLMELLDGRTVAELLARFGRFSPLYAVDIALEVAFGLQAAHEQQIIHRDVQPSNVFVTSAGVVKLLDFSLAKVLGARLETTRRDGAKGTTAFMCPEHLKGAPPNPQFDIYALGMMLWQMLAGRHPFESSLRETMTLVRRQLEEDPASLAAAAGLPAYCDDVIRGATAKDPARRYAGTWALAQALLDLRARLLADPAAAPLVRDPPSWERRVPIARDPEGQKQYRAPISLPSAAMPEAVPSARIVVAPPIEAARVPAAGSAMAGGWRPVAATVPMPAFAAPPAGDLALPAAPPRIEPPSPVMHPAPPTVRARPLPRRRALWPLLVAVALLAAAGAGAWLLLAPDVSSASSGASSADPRSPAPRPKR